MRLLPRLAPILIGAIIASLLTRPGWSQNARPKAIPEALQAAGLQVQEGSFEGFAQSRFELDGVACIIVRPHQPAAGRPWVWRARFWGHEPQFDRAMLERGWHVCYCDVAGLFGDRLLALYEQLGGPIREIRRPGMGHHPHSLKDPAPLVEFALASLK